MGFFFWDRVFCWGREAFFQEEGSHRLREASFQEEGSHQELSFAYDLCHLAMTAYDLCHLAMTASDVFFFSFLALLFIQLPSLLD